MRSNGVNKIAFSIDTDDWYHAHGISGADFSLYPDSKIFLENWKKPYDYISRTGINLLNALEDKNMQITFFVIADQIKRYPEFMDRLKNSNHEIACHSLYHTVPFSSKNNSLRQSKEQWKSELVEAIAILNNYFNKDIIGYRAPGAFFTDWMIPILLESGIKYDSSVVTNSFYSKNKIEYTGYKTTPFMYKGIVELPWSNYKLGPFYFPLGGAFFYRLAGNIYFKQGLKQNLRRGDTQFYMHILDMVNEDFPFGNNKKRPLYWINKGDKTERKLDNLLDYFDNCIVTCKTVYERFQNEKN